MSSNDIRIDTLRAVIADRGWNQAKLATELGKTASQVSHWFKKMRPIGDGLAIQIEKKLNLPIGFLDGDPQKQETHIKIAGGAISIQQPTVEGLMGALSQERQNQVWALLFELTVDQKRERAKIEHSVSNPFASVASAVKT